MMPDPEMEDGFRTGWFCSWCVTQRSPRPWSAVTVLDGYALCAFHTVEAAALKPDADPRYDPLPPRPNPAREAPWESYPTGDA